MALPPPIQAEIALSIETEYLANVDMVTLANKYKISTYRIKQCLADRGVKIRSRSEAVHLRHQQRKAKIDEDELKSLINQKLSTTEIGKRLKLSQPTIENRMRQLGLKSLRGKAWKLDTNPFWSGGKTVDKHGYILIKSPDHPFANRHGYVREHRLVMEKKLGRYLTRLEVVHHKDKDVANNDPDNLELFSENAEHLKHELTGCIPNFTASGMLKLKSIGRQLYRHNVESGRLR